MSQIVLTLDAGGTNFVFSAIQDAEEIIQPVTLSAKQETLEDILKMIISGFQQVKDKLSDNPVAISFSFPGPAEYELGIIEDLQNLPLFRGGIALGPMLEEIFNIPVFINNDGDLFAYGEAIAGFLPYVNKELEYAGSPKRYKNLLGVTFGTGFGGGIIMNGDIYSGDNSAQGEINRFCDKFCSQYSSEESTTIKAIKRLYCEFSGIHDDYEPKDIYEIAVGKKSGNKVAACKTFSIFAEAAGTALANAASLTDGLVVIGGGIAKAYPLFMNDLVSEMNKPFLTHADKCITRMEVSVFNLEDEKSFKEFCKGNKKTINVPFSNKAITYDSMKRIGVGVTRLGTEKAVSIGAYYYAIKHIKK